MRYRGYTGIYGKNATLGEINRRWLEEKLDYLEEQEIPKSQWPTWLHKHTKIDEERGYLPKQPKYHCLTGTKIHWRASIGKWFETRQNEVNKMHKETVMRLVLFAPYQEVKTMLVGEKDFLRLWTYFVSPSMTYTTIRCTYNPTTKVEKMAERQKEWEDLFGRPGQI